MQETNKKKIWQAPWGYPESFAIVGGLVIIGLVLQLVVGAFNFYLLAAPVNVLLCALIIVLSVVFGLRCKKSAFVRWLSGVSLSVALILALLCLGLVMGLVPQRAHSHSPFGLEAMTSNWAFVLVYMVTLLSLGVLVVRKLRHFSFKQIPFYLNHLGLWLVLMASGLGYADMQRYVMYVNEGETEWRVYDAQNNIKELPLAIGLNDFSMEVYKPKLVVIDRETGEIQPTEKPEFFQIEDVEQVGQLYGWHIELVDYIHKAIRNGEDNYREIVMPGSSPAAFVRASNGEQTNEGWVCAGNASQLHSALVLNDSLSLVMTSSEPRSFSSDVEVYTEDGATYKAVIEVNKPLRLNSWTIYQYGYDNSRGNLSEYSSFELVYDRWLIFVYVGVILMMLGSLTMVWSGRKNRDL